MTDQEGVRAGCHGLPPLRARLEPWQVALLSEPDRLRSWVREFGSPLNLHSTEPFERNVQALQEVARTRGVALEILFARKANKALAYVDRARRIGIGVDTASQAELTQALAIGVRPDRLLVTAAVKSVELVRTCIEASVSIVVDNPDELARVDSVAAHTGKPASIFVRINGFRAGGEELQSRFGVHPDEVPALVDSILIPPNSDRIRLAGLHFHLDGYESAHRIAGLTRSLLLADELRARGHSIQAIDIGGGFPVCYLEDPEEWQVFRRALDEALLEQRPPITYRNDGLGRIAVAGRIVGDLGLYPGNHDPVAPGWLEDILDAPFRPGTGSLAEALRMRSLVLRCEPGRSLLDGCGLTIARVEHRKRHRDGLWSIGVAMNRSQCATAKPDHAVDPLLVENREVDGERTPPMEGYLMGAYCTESDLLSKRKLRFPRGVAGGDLIAFPNTAGYLMHFVESRSHQFPLARNMVVGGPDLDAVTPDPIDEMV